MTLVRLLAELASVAGRLGVEVRSDGFGRGALGEHGGLCWVRGKPLIVLDEALPLTDRVALLAGALAGFDLEPVPMPPLVRQAIEARRPAQVKARARRRKPARPGLARAKPRARGRRQARRA